MPEVRTATRADIAQIGEAMSRAFEDDPVWTWLVPRHNVRWAKAAPGFFRSDLISRLPFEHVYTTEGREGVAAWMPPEKWQPTLRDVASHTPSALRLFGTGLPHALRYLLRSEKLHPVDPPHWYLALLGTDPPHQGKGIGSALMKPILDRCDDEGLPAYLESSKESNIAYYARHGFEQRDPFVTEGGPTLFTMWREPR